MGKALDALDQLIDQYESLDPNILKAPVNGYDLKSLLWLLKELMKEKDETTPMEP